MSRVKHREDIHGHIVDAAAEWFVEFNTDEPDANKRRQFDSWLRKSPEHLRAYLEMFPLWDDARRVDPAHELSADELIRLSQADSANLIALPNTGALPRSVAVHGARIKALALAASAVLVALGAWIYVQRNVYSTGVGEQRLITLDDGSSLELNARSRLKVKFSKSERNVELLDGQALFRVAKDALRPFVVLSGDTRIRAVGTQFDVYKKQAGTTVTVLEGRVAVTSTPANSNGGGGESTDLHSVGNAADRGPPELKELLLDAGEQATVTAAAIKRPLHPDLDAATAWREHRLVFSATPLSEVADEFNRYNERQIVVRNESAAPFEVSGAFSMTDLPALLHFLHAQSNVHIEEDKRQVVVTLK
jgi:transmembrane sensor